MASFRFRIREGFFIFVRGTSRGGRLSHFVTIRQKVPRRRHKKKLKHPGELENICWSILFYHFMEVTVVELRSFKSRVEWFLETNFSSCFTRLLWDPKYKNLTSKFNSKFNFQPLLLHFACNTKICNIFYVKFFKVAPETKLVP